MYRSAWLAVALSLTAVPALAQKAPAFDAGRLSRHVQALSADSLEGRAPASRGEAMTVDYLVREFKAAGLRLYVWTVDDDEKVAAEELKGGVCDITNMTSMQARSFNKFHQPNFQNSVPEST